MNDIGTFFLLLSLLLPRFTLFFWWLCGNLPFNTTPLAGDILATMFVPRILILVWIFDIQGFSTWFVIHLIGLFIAWGGGILRTIAVASRSSR